MKITKKTTLLKIIKQPGTEKILAKHKVPCLTCPMAKFEMENLTIGQVCQMYGIDSEKLLKELNNYGETKSIRATKAKSTKSKSH